MILLEWRKNADYSQADLAVALEAHATKLDPLKPKKLPQRTLGYWEQGVMPRKFWLKVIKDFTKGKVSSEDFVQAADAHP